MNNWRWTLRYARSVKGWLALTTLLFLLEMVANVGLIGIQKFIVDDLFVARNWDMLVPLLAGLATLAVIYNVLHLYAAIARNMAVFGLQKKLFTEMLHALHRTPVKSFHKQRIGKYVTNLTTDIDGASNFIGSRLPTGVMNIGEAILLSVIIGMASPVLLLVVLIVSIPYMIVGRKMAPKMKQAGKALAGSGTAVTIAIEEGISSSREVIAFHRQSWEKQRFREKLAVHFNNLMKQVKLTNQQTLLSLIMQWGVRVAALGYGGFLVFHEQMTIGWLIIVFQFSSQLMDAYSRVFGFAVEVSGDMAVVERIREVTEGEQHGEGTLPFPVEQPIAQLSFAGVSFRYGEDDQNVLNGIDMELPSGLKIAFVGRSGSGKSTLAQLLIRFYEPEAGVIAVNGEQLSHLRRSDWMKRVTIVFQDAYLFPDSIRNNLLLGRQASEERMKDVCQKMQIHDLIVSLPEGYDTQVGERGIKLSGGQRQRIALARALLADSEILILDESTSALDLETERLVMRHLTEMRRNQTTIVIAHRLSTIRDADLIIVLDHGRIVEQGTYDQLMYTKEDSIS